MTICNTYSFSRSNRPVVFLKLTVLKNFEMIIAVVSFLIIMQTRNFIKTVLLHWCFLWALRNDSEQLFSRKHVNDCFWISTVDYAGHKAYFENPRVLNSYFTILLQPENGSRTIAPPVIFFLIVIFFPIL